MNNYQDLLNQIKPISYYVTGEAVKVYHERTAEIGAILRKERGKAK